MTFNKLIENSKNKIQMHFFCVESQLAIRKNKFSQISEKMNDKMSKLISTRIHLLFVM